MNLLEISFKDVAWLQSFPLNSSTVLEYFSLSQFYDRTCNNQVLKMQTAFNNFEELDQSLSNMVGIEYVVSLSQEPFLFCIRKQKRTSPKDAELIDSYYVLEGTIYQCPDLYSILSMRLSACVYYSNIALQEASQKVTQDGEWKHEVKTLAHSSDISRKINEQIAVDSAVNSFLKDMESNL